MENKIKKSPTLFVVATPIGNKEDISFRAVKTFKSCSAIITENQKTTKKLLSILGIRNPKKFITLGDFNNKNITKFIEFINENKQVALVSEAGTPLISDPGFKLINYIRSEKIDINIEAIPGASALTTFLSISGLPTDKVLFLGFLPKKPQKRKQILLNLNEINTLIKTTFVLLESKYKIIKTLTQISNLYPQAKISIGKELTKIHQRVYYGNIKDIIKEIKKDKIKGEFIIHLSL